MSCDMASLQFYACAKERQRKAVLTKSFLATMSQELVEEVKDKQAPDPPTAPQLESECDGEASGEVQQLSSRQMIEQNLEEMITEMNAKRSRDQTLLENLKKDLDSWCASAHVAIEAALYEKTVKNSKLIDSKLRELVDALGRIRKLESEMEQFREQLGAFCVGVR